LKSHLPKICRPEKGKPLERVGRKVTGPHFDDEAAGLPGKYSTIKGVFARLERATEVL